MKIVVTAAEILNRGAWDTFCERRGLNPWCMNEGLMSSDEEFTLSAEEAVSYGFPVKANA